MNPNILKAERVSKIFKSGKDFLDNDIEELALFELEDTFGQSFRGVMINWKRFDEVSFIHEKDVCNKYKSLGYVLSLVTEVRSVFNLIIEIPLSEESFNIHGICSLEGFDGYRKQILDGSKAKLSTVANSISL